MSAPPTAKASLKPLPAPTASGTIVFMKVITPWFGGNGDVYVVHPDGTGLKAIADSPGWETHPSWSPDGRRIVYTLYPAGTENGMAATPWIMNADGSGKKQLTKEILGGDWATWSPDGKLIAFVKFLPKVYDGQAVYLIGADGTGLRRLTHQSIDAAHSEALPSWTVDGRVLLVREGDVWVVNTDGSGLRRLTRNGSVSEYALSPDGKLLAFQDNDKGRVEVVATRGGGSPVKLLGPVTKFIPNDPQASPGWSPDGKAVAIASSLLAGYYGSRLYIVNADGSGLSAVPGIDSAVDPSWRPQ